MKQYGLGPNGGIVTSLNLFATRFDQVTQSDSASSVICLTQIKELNNPKLSGRNQASLKSRLFTFLMLKEVSEDLVVSDVHLL